MRRAPHSVLMLLLALCVGFQSTASAFAKPCAHSRAAPGAEASGTQVGVNHDHAAMATGTGDNGHGHGHHADPAMTGSLDPGADPSASATGHAGCDCGGQCANLDCAVHVPGIASPSISRPLQTTPALFALPLFTLHPRAAHARDLIRPPSRS